MFVDNANVHTKLVEKVPTLEADSLTAPVVSGMKKTPSSMFRIGEDSDSDDSIVHVVNTEDKSAQTLPVEEITSLTTIQPESEPRSLEQCLAVFKSDVSLNTIPN